MLGIGPKPVDLIVDSSNEVMAKRIVEFREENKRAAQMGVQFNTARQEAELKNDYIHSFVRHLSNRESITIDQALMLLRDLPDDQIRIIEQGLILKNRRRMRYLVSLPILGCLPFAISLFYQSIMAVPFFIGMFPLLAVYLGPYF